MLNGERFVWISNIKVLEGLTEMVLGKHLKEEREPAMQAFGEEHSKQKQQQAQRTWGRNKPARFVQGTFKELGLEQGEQQEQWGE